MRSGVVLPASPRGGRLHAGGAAAGHVGRNVDVNGPGAATCCDRNGLAEHAAGVLRRRPKTRLRDGREEAVVRQVLVIRDPLQAIGQAIRQHEQGHAVE
jgi:hypothetical protein